MKKWILLCAALTPFAVQAQPLQKMAQASQAAQKRAARAFEQSELRLRAVNRPSQGVLGAAGVLERLYSPLKPLTEEASSAEFSFADASNRTAAVDRIVRERQLNFLRAHAQEAARAAVVLPFKSAAESAARIPQDARYVFLGQERKDASMSRQISRIISDYAELHPERKVVLMTSFAPDNYPQAVTRFPARGVYKDYAPVFEDLDAKGVEIIGLENPSALHLTREPDGAVVMGEEKTDDAFYYQGGWVVRASASPQGLRARNAHWAARVKEWREKYPDAVFFIYAGAEHVGYDSVFSVSNLLGREDVFVTLLQSEGSVRNSVFHRWTGFRFAKPGVLSFPDKKWARYAGFDEQIIFPG